MLGGLYALFAMGLSLMFGVMRLTNVAHGDFIILTAFAAFAATASLGMNLWIALLLLLPLAFVFGYGLQRGILNGTLGNDPLPSLVVTFGLSIVIQNLLMEIFSADTRSISALGLETKSLQLAENLFVGVLPLIIFLIAVIAAVLVYVKVPRKVSTPPLPLSTFGEVARHATLPRILLVTLVQATAMFTLFAYIAPLVTQVLGSVEPVSLVLAALGVVV